MWSEDQERYVARMIGDVRDRLVLKQDKVTGQDIVFGAICDLWDIHRRQFVAGVRPQQLKAQAMEYVRTPEEIAADIAQRWIDVAAGDPVDIVFGTRSLPSPAEVSTMDAINVVFKSLLKGENKERDWKILHMLTVPHASLRRIGKLFHITHTRVATIKVVQTQSIWDGIRHLLTARTGESVGQTFWSA